MKEDLTGPSRSVLRASDAQLRYLFEDSPIGIALQDRAGRYLRVNEAFCHLVGFPEAEIIGTSWRTLTHPEDVDEGGQDELPGGGRRAGPIEKRYVRRDGKVVWLSVIGSRLPESDGEPVHLIVQAQEIVRRWPESARPESEGQYWMLAEHVTDVIWLFDLSLRLVYVSPSVRALRGYTVEEVLRQPIAERLTPASLALARAVLREELEIEQRPERDLSRGRTIELELRCKDGSTVWTEMKVTMLRDAQERAIGIVGISRDISERRRMDEIRRLQAAALDAAANAIIIADRSGTIQWVNPAFSLLTGYRADEVVGQSPRVLKSGRHDEAFYRSLWACVLDGQVWSGEMVNRRQDGTLYTEHQTVTPVRDPSGAITHFIAIKQDISEQKLLEEELRQAQKMEAIGRLAGGVAHDFNNLLTVIQGRSALLQAHLPAGDPLRRHADLVEQASHRAAALTRQLLAFSRKQVVEPKVLDVAALVRSFEPILGRLIGEDVTLSIASTPPDGRALVDPGQLEQVVLNLVVNARDAMPEGGRLHVETRNFEIDAAYAATHPGASAGPYVLLTVSDTGVGMDAATQARIFEPFFTTKGDQGTGLGLATVYGIVKQARGTVRVYSEPGLGTTFRIYLPRLTDDVSAAGPEVAPPPPRGTETILLVEDEEALLHLTREVLERLGYAVLGARHGGEALLIADGHRGGIDLLLTDVIMPHMNGRELAGRLERARPGLRVLYMSGYTAGVIEHHGVLDPTVSFIQKPFTPAQLARRVREVLDAGLA